MSNVVFDAKKSNCLYVNSCANRSRIASALSPFSVGGNDTEFVEEWPHIGLAITAVRDDKVDAGIVNR